MMNARTWLLAARPKTLTAAFIPIVVGTSLAYGVQGTIQIEYSLLAFLSTLLIQIGTNLINDAMDFKKGADTEERLGPQRVTQSGLLSQNWVFRAGLICFLLAALAGLPLVMEGGWPIVGIGIFSLIAGYAYTAGPFPLAYLGLGDLFVLIFFGWVAVAGMYYLHTGSLDSLALVAGTQIGLLATVMIAINNFRDHRTDRLAEKKTLAVRFGPRFVRIEIAGLCLIPFLAGVYWFGEGWSWAAILPLLIFPMAGSLVSKIFKTEPGSIYNRYLAQGAALHLLFGVLLSLGFLIK